MALYELSITSLLKLMAFLFWANLYLYTTESVKDKNPEWCSRIITLIHGIFATAIGYNQCDVLDNYMCAKYFTGKVSPLRYGLMLWSWGYFAFDILWCLIYWSKANLTLCHHISTLGAITIYMHQDYTGCTFACTLFLIEITNPLLQLRWFLKKEGHEDSRLFAFVEIFYLTLFLIIRGILGTGIMYYVLFKADYFTVEHKIISIIVYVVSLCFLYDILGYLLYKYKKEINIGYRHFAAFCQATCLTFNEWQPLERVPQREVSQKEVPQGEVSQREVPQREISQREVSQREVSQRQVSQIEVSQREISQREVSQREVSQREVPQREVPKLTDPS